MSKMNEVSRKMDDGERPFVQTVNFKSEHFVDLANQIAAEIDSNNRSKVIRYALVNTAWQHDLITDAQYETLKEFAV